MDEARRLLHPPIPWSQLVGRVRNGQGGAARGQVVWAPGMSRDEQMARRRKAYGLEPQDLDYAGDEPSPPGRGWLRLV